MDLNETARLLTFIAGLDPRMATNERDAAIRQQAWQHILRDVDATEAATFTTRYYRQAPQWSIQVGDIYQGCKPTPRWAECEEMTALVGRPVPDHLRAALHLDDRRHTALQRPCPWPPCHATVGRPCTVEGQPLTAGRVHPSRAEGAA